MDQQDVRSRVAGGRAARSFSARARPSRWRLASRVWHRDRSAAAPPKQHGGGSSDSEVQDDQRCRDRRYASVRLTDLMCKLTTVARREHEPEGVDRQEDQPPT